jgi:hypothetical protein
MNAQPSGQHEVHNLRTCHNLPNPENRKHLGEFSSCHGAVTLAKRTYNKADGCAFCCPQCNHG